MTLQYRSNVNGFSFLTWGNLMPFGFGEEMVRPIREWPATEFLKNLLIRILRNL